MHNSDHSDKESCWGGLDGLQIFMSLAVVVKEKLQAFLHDKELVAWAGHFGSSCLATSNITFILFHTQPTHFILFWLRWTRRTNDLSFVQLLQVTRMETNAAEI